MGGAGSFRSNLNIVSCFDSRPEFIRHSSHKANDDFLYGSEALELG